MSILLPALIMLCWAEPPVHIRAAERAFQEGTTAAAAGNFEEASQHLEAAIRIEPGYLEAYDALSRALLASNHTSEAGRILIRLLQMQPDSTAHRVMLGSLLLRMGETARALAQFSRAIEAENASADALAGFAEAARAQHLPDKAEAALARGRTLHPGDSRFQHAGQP